MTVDSEEIIELEYQANKTLLIKHAIGGLLPGLAATETARIHNVLEIGCGPGSWTLDMAETYYRQQMQIVGIDTGRIMIAHANAEAQDRHLSNVRHLQVPHLAGPFAFPNRSFDLISSQFLSKVLFRDAWKDLIRECRRMLRPGGWLRLTDFEVGESNSPAHEELWTLFIRAMRQAGRSFSQGDRHLGVLSELEPLLVEAGFRDTFCLGHMINYSNGAPYAEEWKRDFLLFTQGIQSLLVKTEVSTREHVTFLQQQQQQEMGLRTFHGMLPMLTVWGRK